MPPRMDGYEGLLHEVFRLRWTVADARKSLFEVTAQMTAQSLEKRPMSRSIAMKAGHHQGSEFLFRGVRDFDHWLIRMEMCSTAPGETIAAGFRTNRCLFGSEHSPNVRFLSEHRTARKPALEALHHSDPHHVSEIRDET